MRFETTHSMSYDGPLDTFDDETDRLYEVLLGAEGIEDPDLAINQSTGEIEVGMVVEAETIEDAVAQAICYLRAAIHEIGGYTPGWEKHMQDVAAGVRVLV